MSYLKGSHPLTNKNQILSWIKSPTFKDWIEIMPNDSRKVFCKYCKSTLNALRTSSIKHATSFKHRNNWKNFQNRHQDVSIQMPELTQNAAQTSEEQQRMKNIFCHESVEDSLNLKYESAKTSDEYLFANNDLASYEIDNIRPNQQQQNYQPTTMSLCDYFNTKNQNAIMLSQCENVSHRTTGKNMTISTHILDTSQGKPASNVPVILYYFQDGQWKEVNRSITNSDGRVPSEQLIKSGNFTTGLYKLHFNLEAYFKALETKAFYPFVEVTFMCEETQHYHVPLLLSPFGYSTYRGS